MLREGSREGGERTAQGPILRGPTVNLLFFGEGQEERVGLSGSESDVARISGGVDSRSGSESHYVVLSEFWSEGAGESGSRELWSFGGLGRGASREQNLKLKTDEDKGRIPFGAGSYKPWFLRVHRMPDEIYVRRDVSRAGRF